MPENDADKSKIKKNEIVESFKGAFAGFGICVVISTAVGFLYNGFSKNLPQSPQTGDEKFSHHLNKLIDALGAGGLISLSALAPISIFCGYASHDLAKKHNAQVDKIFEKRLKREETAKAAASSTPPGASL